MIRRSTIFLATDGRYVTLGRGDACEMSAATLAGVCAQGLRGWVAVADHRGRTPTLARVHALQGALDTEWRAASDAFQRAYRSRGVVH